MYMYIISDFRNTFIGALLKLKHSLSRGMFVHSCYLHGHILIIQEWTCSSLQGNNILANKVNTIYMTIYFFNLCHMSALVIILWNVQTIAQAISDW